MTRTQIPSSRTAAFLAATGIAAYTLFAPTMSDAQGEQVLTLSCAPAMAGPPFVLKLDMINKTASGDGQYGYDPREPRSIIVSDDDITWVVEGDSKNSLSRVTGSFLSVGIGTSTGGRWSAQCQKSERKF